MTVASSRWESWGRHPPAPDQVGIVVSSRTAPLPTSDRTLLPRGLGRSYGDSCLNDGGALVLATGLDRLMAFDPETGVLRCEAGVSLADVLDAFVPRGLMVPVTPGTKHVTIGGAIANDVHGKNHHRAGSFGNHVQRFELLRSDGSRVTCSRDANVDLFRATIGGLGLTGLVTWAELRLVRIAQPAIDQEIVRFRGIEEILALSEDSDARFEHSVAWVDCAATGKDFGRGIFIRGNYATAEVGEPDPLPARERIPVPVMPPFCPLNRWSVRAFNALYFRRTSRALHRSRASLDQFFYPLDAVAGWNKVYGPKGFLQHQCVVPDTREGREVVSRILRRTAEAGLGSPLVVLKRFGNVPSEGMLSFPRPGLTLAVDFPVAHGAPLFALLEDADRRIVACGGAVYPAKDARMSRETFRASFPRLDEFRRFVDPRFSSSFWRRVGEP